MFKCYNNNRNTVLYDYELLELRLKYDLNPRCPLNFQVHVFI